MSLTSSDIYDSMAHMFAVIKTGGKQYVVTPGTKLKIEKIEGIKGDSVSFSDVLLTSDEKKVSVGTPIVEGAKVTGTIVSQTRDTKKLIFRFHSKVRYRKTKGHRQPLTEVQITDIK